MKQGPLSQGTRPGKGTRDSQSVAKDGVGVPASPSQGLTQGAPCPGRVSPGEKVQLGSLGTEGVQEGPRCLGPRVAWSIGWLVTGRAGCVPGVRPCGISGSLQIWVLSSDGGGHATWLGLIPRRLSGCFSTRRRRVSPIARWTRERVSTAGPGTVSDLQVLPRSPPLGH